MSQIETYITANVEYEEAKSQLAGAAELIRQVGISILNNPEAFMFSNTSGEGLPMDIALNRNTKGMDANSWPTPEMFHAMISRRFRARRAVQEAWNAIPESMQASLVAPRL